jgi:hypothetical protein
VASVNGRASPVGDLVAVGPCPGSDRVVDAYNLQSTPVRNMLVRYLEARVGWTWQRTSSA